MKTVLRITTWIFISLTCSFGIWLFYVIVSNVTYYWHGQFDGLLYIPHHYENASTEQIKSMSIELDLQDIYEQDKYAIYLPSKNIYAVFALNNENGSIMLYGYKKEIECPLTHVRDIPVKEVISFNDSFSREALCHFEGNYHPDLFSYLVLLNGNLFFNEIKYGASYLIFTIVILVVSYSPVNEIFS